LDTINKLVVRAPVYNLVLSILSDSDLEAREGVVVPCDEYLANNYQVFEAVIVPRYIQRFNLVRSRLICEGGEGFIVVTLYLHDLDSRGNFNSVVVPVDLEVLEVVPNMLMAIVQVNDVRILVLMVLLLVHAGTGRHEAGHEHALVKLLCLREHVHEGTIQEL